MDYQTNAKIAARTVVNVTGMTQNYYLATTANDPKGTLLEKLRELGNHNLRIAK